MRGRAVILISMSSELNVGYYFHPQAVFGPNGTAKTEAHWGLFIRALAAELGQVTYYAHSGEGNGIENFELGPADHIRCVNLGPRHRRPLMFLFPWLCLRNFKPKADGLYAARSSLLAIMGRMAAYTGQVVTWEMALNSKESLGPAKYVWGDAPAQPVAKPGLTKFA